MKQIERETDELVFYTDGTVRAKAEIAAINKAFDDAFWDADFLGCRTGKYHLFDQLDTPDSRKG